MDDATGRPKRCFSPDLADLASWNPTLLVRTGDPSPTAEHASGRERSSGTSVVLTTYGASAQLVHDTAMQIAALASAEGHDQTDT